MPHALALPPFLSSLSTFWIKLRTPISRGNFRFLGEPLPEDLRMEQHCEHMLASLSRAEPAFDLYDGLLKDARSAIARQRKTKESIEEEDD